MRAVVLAEASQPSNPKFDGTCYSLKVRSLVFDDSNPCADRFTLVRHEISEYFGKEYTDEGDVRWTSEQEKMKTTLPLSSMGEDAAEADKEIFKVEVSEYVKRRNRMRYNLEKSIYWSYDSVLSLPTYILKGFYSGMPQMIFLI